MARRASAGATTDSHGHHSRFTQIKASAGSGKTHDLTRRFLSHVAEITKTSDLEQSTWAGWLKGILAITFTNSAAAEMRRRILFALKQSALADGSGMDAIVDSATARQCVESIMRDADALNVRTIDSVLHQIVRTSALELGLAPDFQPAFDCEEVFAPFFEKFLEMANQGDEAMQKVLRGMCRTLALKEGSKTFVAGKNLQGDVWDILNALLPDLWDTAMQSENQVECAGAMPESQGNGGFMHQGEIEAIFLPRREALFNAASSFLSCVNGDEALAASLVSNARNAMQALADRRIPSLTFPRKETADELFKKNHPPIPSAVAKCHAKVKELADWWVEDGLLLQRALNLAPFVDFAYLLADAYIQMRGMEQLLPTLLVPSMALDVLDGGSGVPNAICRMGTSLRHILLDEFQDTDATQWQTLRPFAMEALAHGGSLTWVGDVKQSIFGWRGGDSSLFEKIYEDIELRNAVGSEHTAITLRHNWRSHAEIIDFNNSLFVTLSNAETAQRVLATMIPKASQKDVLLERASRRLAADYADCEQQYSGKTRSGGTVVCRWLEAEQAEEGRQLVLDCLRRTMCEFVQSGGDVSDVLVLARKNKEIADICHTLLELGIPFITENSLRLADNPLVIQSVSLLRFLANPQDDLAFLSVVCGSLVQEHPFVRTRVEGDALIDLYLESKASGNKRPLFYQLFREHHADIWEKLIAPFFNQAGLMTPYDTVMEWYARLSAEQRFPKDEAYLRHFMEILHMAGEDGMATLPTFLEFWDDNSVEERLPMPDECKAVRVMTIHKAKGLEKPVVIVPFSDFSCKADDSMLVQYHDGRPLLVRNGKDLGLPFDEAYVSQALEAVNLLYVAFTRASRELHVFHAVKTKEGEDASALAVMFEQAGLEFSDGREWLGEDWQESLLQQKAAPSHDEGHADVAVDEVTGLDGEGWIPVEWMSKLKVFRNPLQQAITAVERGTLLHCALEHLTVGGDPEKAAHTALLRAGLQGEADDKDVQAIAWFASQPCAAHWRERGLPEQPVLDADGNEKRMDMLVREDWGLLVADYKSGAENAEHLTQVREYMDIVAALYPDTVVQGVLVYLDLQKFKLVRRNANAKPSPMCDRLEELDLEKEACA